MTEIEHFAESFGLRYDKFQTPKFLQENGKLTFPNESLLFFNRENKNTLIEQNIKENYAKITEDFTHTPLNFIFLPKTNLSPNLENILKYYLPELRNCDFNNSINKKDWVIAQALDKEFEDENYYMSIYHDIMQTIGYAGDIKCGFVINYDGFNYVLGCNEHTYFFNSGNLLEALILFFKSKVFSNYDFESIHNSLYGDLDKETEESIAQIAMQLEEIKKSGQLLVALPVIKQILSRSIAENDFVNNNLSEIKFNLITYQINLPQFGNVEVKMSHLTKAVYLLFYNHPQGINLKEISNYSNELLDNYSRICPYSDLDKIKKSIDDIINIETRAIYTHISRIKSAFLNLMDYEYAKHYFVTGSHHGDAFKYIPIINRIYLSSKNIFEEDEDEGTACSCGCF